MSDIQPGDLVVCVDDSPRAGPAVTKAPVRDFVRRGRVYRIEGVFLSVSGVVGVFLLGDPNTAHRPGCGWHADRFRKLNDEPDNIEIVELIKRPIRNPVEA